MKLGAMTRDIIEEELMIILTHDGIGKIYFSANNKEELENKWNTMPRYFDYLSLFSELPFYKGSL